MVENKVYIAFGIIGLILAITGVIITIFSKETGMYWALFGSRIAIIWVSFHKVYHRGRHEEK
ncbi:MAG: hypothetical protein ACTSUK_01690 [Promethearchaeota archaeon]